MSGGARAFDWSTWVPGIRATLMFVRRGDEVLLIRKKRGIGAGKINGPGGKIDPGETALESAVRETTEELGVVPLNARQTGELCFAMSDMPHIHCHVFMADAFIGEAVETDEAVPLWTPVDRIPYHEMWEDDIHWLPQMLRGGTFLGRFVFSGERLVERQIEWDVAFGEEICG